MPDHPLQKLRRNCNLATRQFLFEKAENILPFQLSYPQDYPQEGTNRGHNPNERLQIRMNWVRNALTKNVLGEFHFHTFSLAVNVSRAPSGQYHIKKL